MEANDLLLRTMEARDIPVGMRLKELVGWNQTEADWQAMMRMEPEGCFAAEKAGKVVATGTAMAFSDRIGWIGMILVDPEFRRQGIATRIMDCCLDHLERIACPCIKLDATEDGAKVYRNLGFEFEYLVERWKRPAGVYAAATAAMPGLGLILPGQVDAIAAADASAFGANRGKLLAYYVDSGYPAYMIGSVSELRGYVLGRQGTHSFQIGPLVCFDGQESTAVGLFDAILARIGEQPAIVDLIMVNPAAMRIAAERGFASVRVLQRMFRGANLFPGKPEQVYALAGFEFG